METAEVEIALLAYTAPAIDAFAIKKHWLDRFRLAFGVVAPRAPQIAALEKDSGADSGSVVGAESLDVKYGSFHNCSVLRSLED